jgi:hypothetical protein
MQNQGPIDAVITWVDGNEPSHKKKMHQYLKDFTYIPEFVAGSTRYNSVGEIFFCIASILRFAPFIRKIFIVTDNQTPPIDEFIQKNFPLNKITITIVDHTVIFKGYEQFLPTFNSLSIETCLFRIPDLSENFVYFNDDVFLIRPTKPTDFFVDNNIVAHGDWRSIFFDQLLSLIKPKKNGHKRFGFKDGMIRAAKTLGISPYYFHLDHTPHPQKKELLEQFYSKNPEIFLKNISYRFRNSAQFNPQALSYMLGFKTGKSIKKKETRYLYLKPIGRENGYINRKLKLYNKNPQINFCCINSIDLATEKDRTILFDWLKKLLNVTIEI